MIDNISTRYRTAVVIYPYHYHFRIPQDSIFKVDKYDITNYISEVSFSKDKSNPSGSFSIALHPYREWENIIRPGDWLTIYKSQFDIDINSTKGLRVLGNVDRISKQKSMGSDGSYTIRYRIDGRDFGKVFEDTKWFQEPQYPGGIKEAIIAPYIDDLKGLGIKYGTPKEIIPSIFNLYYGSKNSVHNNSRIQKNSKNPLNQVQLPKEIYKLFGINKTNPTFLDLVKLDIDQNISGSTNDIHPDKMIGGSFWEMAKQLSNPAINEMYTCMKYDVKKGIVFPTIVLREMPFGQDKFTKLPANKIDSLFILSQDLGYSDHERKNILLLNGMPTSASADPNSFFVKELAFKTTEDPNGLQTTVNPFQDIISIQRYGVRLMQLSTEFIWNSSSKTSDSPTPMKMMENWIMKLVEWWIYIARCESGQIITKGFYKLVPPTNPTKKEIWIKSMDESSKALSQALGTDILIEDITYSKVVKESDKLIDHIDVGENAWIPKSDTEPVDKLFHIEGYVEEWKAPGTSFTTLTLIRGVNAIPGASEFTYFDQIKNRESQREIGVSSYVFETNGKLKDGEDL